MCGKELSEGEKEKVRSLLGSMGMQGINTDSFITQTFSDDGINFSGGEAQKLAIVRALYKDAPIIVLDEPTSALSPQSEYEIYRSFNALTKNKTVLFISHRLSSCRICDKILLLHNGDWRRSALMMSFSAQMHFIQRCFPLRQSCSVK